MKRLYKVHPPLQNVWTAQNHKHSLSVWNIPGVFLQTCTMIALDQSDSMKLPCTISTAPFYPVDITSNECWALSHRTIPYLETLKKINVDGYKCIHDNAFHMHILKYQILSTQMVKINRADFRHFLSKTALLSTIIIGLFVHTKYWHIVWILSALPNSTRETPHLPVSPQS